ncbi:MAG: acyl-CoA--6-aminopenicillanic acid acyl-transferase, partial [Christensenellaceae bacterium]|nr:acyl-CoA--6-aminopenicillanic acid acyl-transferase [Christensenellaceae bacterium]
VGFAHGSGAKERVHTCLHAYRNMFAAQGIGWDAAREQAKTHIPAIEAYHSDLLDEMRGVADGAGLPFEDILVLNARSEITFAMGGKKKESDGCTSAAVTPERTADGHMLIGQNWDWKKPLRQALVLLKVISPGEPDILMLTEAGILGKMGMNSAGLALCLNALAADYKPEGVPLLLALRRTLEAETLMGAVREATRARVGCCGNFLLGHRDGEALDVELACEDFDVLYPKESILVHSNHFVSPRLPRYPHFDTMKRGSSSSFMRLGRADKLFRAAGKADVETFRRVFADHADHPHGICSHENEKDAPADRYCTVCAYVADLTAMDMYICPGNPCEQPFAKVNFFDIQ